MLLFSRPSALLKTVRKARRRPVLDDDIEEAQEKQYDHFEQELALAFLAYISALQVTLERFEGQPADGYLSTGGVIDQLMEQTSKATLLAVIGDITRAGVAASAQHVPVNLASSLTLSADNQFLQQYISEETGRLIVAVSDSVRQQVKDVIAEAARTGAAPADIAKKLQDTIGLNPQQAAQYARFVGSPKAKQQFLQKLQEQRAMTVARSETVLAFQHAQLASWQYAVEQGVIDDYTEKEWLTDTDPCKERCEPMRGQRRPLDQPFITGMGEEVMAPGAHPRCRCMLRLIRES